MSKKMSHSGIHPSPPSAFPIQYTIECRDPFAHLLKVNLTIQAPLATQKISLPTWIPGSYLIRDFAKHIVEISAKDCQGNPLLLTPEGLSSWRFNATDAVEIEYFVYAWDLSVRKAHFDQTHAFFNGTSVFLAVENQRDCPAKVSLIENAFTKQACWKCATGMPSINTNPNGFGDYWAQDYRDLIEYPFEIGNYQQVEFEAGGIEHRMVFTGRLNSNTDLVRIARDVQKICATEIEFFGLQATHNPPMQSYLFQVMVTTSDYGGLEHRNSTALICSRDDLAFIGMEQATDGYLQFLELCSHEYFHTWNVKRILPKPYQESLLDKPAMSHQLWWFEGVTSYYDALFLLKSDLIDHATYMNLLAKQLSKIYLMPGRFKQSLADSSHYTWTKFYQQDEDAPNSIISYYTKGSLVALALDLTLRAQTQNHCSLDTVVRHLWENFGSKNQGLGQGLEEKQIETICSQLCMQHGGQSLEPFFEQALYQTEDLDLEALFKPFGYRFVLRPAQNPGDQGGNLDAELLDKLVSSPPSSIGARLQDLPTGGGVLITHVWHQQAAYQAGLTQGDELVAIDGLRVQSKSQVEQLLSRHNPQGTGQTWQCHYFRRDELYQTSLTPMPAQNDRVTLQYNEALMEEPLSWLESEQ